MSERTLRGCRVLVVEDEYLLAEDLRTELNDLGAIVVGMVGTVTDALERINAEDGLDGVVLDVNLGGRAVFPVADRLVERNVPFLFATGYDESAIPARYRNIARCEKPVDMARVVAAIGRVT